MILENKPYDTNASPEEVALIKQSVQMLNDSTIIFKEVFFPNPFTIGITFLEMGRLTSEHPGCCILIDLTDAGRPDAESRKEIHKGFLVLQKNIKHVAYFTGKNFIINTAIKFVMYGTGVESFSVHKAKENALIAIDDFQK